MACAVELALRCGAHTHQQDEREARMASIIFFLTMLARLRYQGRRRRLVERTLHKMGFSRRQCDRIARRIP